MHRGLKAAGDAAVDLRELALRPVGRHHRLHRRWHRPAKIPAACEGTLLNQYTGSDCDDFLREEGILEEVTATTITALCSSTQLAGGSVRAVSPKPVGGGFVAI